MLSLKVILEKAGRAEQDVLDDILAAQALPSLMRPADLADLHLFLACDGARNVTGQAYNIDRGD
jgi:3-hydroxybutyrate dehydrogenase